MAVHKVAHLPPVAFPAFGFRVGAQIAYVTDGAKRPSALGFGGWT